MQVKVDAPTRFIRAGFEDPYERLRRLERQGHTYGPDSAARRYAYASSKIMETWAVRFFVPPWLLGSLAENRLGFKRPAKK